MENEQIFDRLSELYILHCANNLHAVGLAEYIRLRDQYRVNGFLFLVDNNRMPFSQQIATAQPL